MITYMIECLGYPILLQDVIQLLMQIDHVANSKIKGLKYKTCIHLTLKLLFNWQNWQEFFDTFLLLHVLSTREPQFY